MKKVWFAVFLPVLLLVIVGGCSRSHTPREDVSRTDTAVSGGRKGDERIVKAIESAYGLEAVLWKNAGNIKSREDVKEIFRRGFSEQLAEQITAYLWMDEPDEGGESFGMLRASDPLLTLPDSIEVESVKGDTAHALLKYAENTEGPVTWDAHTTSVTLKTENGVWKIYAIESD